MLRPTAASALYPATTTSSGLRRHQIVAMRCDVVVTPRGEHFALRPDEGEWQ